MAKLSLRQLKDRVSEKRRKYRAARRRWIETDRVAVAADKAFCRADIELRAAEEAVWRARNG